MKKLVNKVKTWLGLKQSTRKLIYRNAKGETKMYIVNEPEVANRIGNKKEHQKEVGFCVRVHNKEPNAVRSFRHDRIVAVM